MLGYKQMDHSLITILESNNQKIKRVLVPLKNLETEYLTSNGYLHLLISYTPIDSITLQEDKCRYRLYVRQKEKTTISDIAMGANVEAIGKWIAYFSGTQDHISVIKFEDATYTRPISILVSDPLNKQLSK